MTIARLATVFELIMSSCRYLVLDVYRTPLQALRLPTLHQSHNAIKDIMVY